MASLQCPRCAVALKTTKAGRLCPKCDGCWLTHDQVQEALNQTEQDLKKAGLGKTLELDTALNTQHAVRCPQCSIRLKRSEYIRGSGLMVDSCYEHGMWLDDGELRELREYINKT